MSLVQLSDGVESAVARLDEVGGASLHDDAQVRNVGIVQSVNALIQKRYLLE